MRLFFIANDLLLLLGAHSLGGSMIKSNIIHIRILLAHRTSHTLVGLSLRNNRMAVGLTRWNSEESVRQLVLLDAGCSKLVGAGERRCLQVELLQEW